MPKRISLAPQVNAQPVEKSYFTFVAGLNTDASPLNFPDNFSSAEENFVLNIDGSRQRRKGLALETGGEELTFASASTGVTRCHHWRNVNGNPALNFIVIQDGSNLWIYPDAEVISADDTVGYLDLTDMKSSNTFTDAQVAASPVNTDYGRGHLFVVGQYIKPCYITWDDDTSTATFVELDLKERDFWGIEDGVDNNTTPSGLTDEHQYNLLIRGWTPSLYNAVQSSKSYYPSKAMIPWMGYKETVNTSVNTAEEIRGVETFSSDRLVSMLWQDASAPTGHLFKSPFSDIAVANTGTVNYAITNVYFDDASGGATTGHIRVDTTHGITDNDSIAIDGCYITYQVAVPSWKVDVLGETIERTRSIDGTYTAQVDVLTITGATSANPIVFTSTAHGLITGHSVTLASLPGDFGTNLNGNDYPVTRLTADTFSISVDGGGYAAYTTGGTATPANFFKIDITIPDMSEGYETATTGTVWTAIAGDPTVSKYRPMAVAWFAGRVWYAGTPNPNTSHKVFFSQTVEQSSQYTKCYQVADPTNKYISDLVDTDGGVITIPEMDTARELVAYNGRLLVFADNGVWEISGGQREYFTATSYSVRQISNIGCAGAFTVMVADGIPFYWGDSGIYNIQQDPDTGFLYVSDISTGRIQKLINSLSKAAKEQIQVAYDRNSKKLYWLYDSDSGTDWKYDTWLVLDLRINAYSKFANKSTDYDIRAIYDIEDYQPDSSEQRNIKFMCFSTDRLALRISELNDSSFEDFGTDAAAYLETGNDTLGDPSRRRYGRYLFTYMKRTETGYNEVDEDWVPINPSLLYVRYIWNWADSSNTGKWSAQQSVYKETLYKYRRPWIPSTSTDLMGEAVVVNKSKIRGSGRVLRLRFDTLAGYDAHLYGWHLRQDITMEA